MELHSQLVGLVALGRGLLNRLYDFNVWRSNPFKGSEFLTDQRFAKVNKALTVRYPEQLPMDKVSDPLSLLFTFILINFLSY